MSGALLAAAAGIGFGAFQTLNRRAVQGIPDAVLATFLQLLIAVTVLVALSLATQDLGELGRATTASLLWFALAGLVHFSLGWTLLNKSQIRIGAARTSPLLSTNPLFGAVLAAAVLRELPRLLAWVGIAAVTVGALVVSLGRVGDAGWEIQWRDSGWGLATALAWAVSPLMIREGLEGLHSPLLGVTVSMVAAVLAYALLLAVRGRATRREIHWTSLWFKLAAGVFVALSTWLRWLALDYTEIAVVLALGLLSVPMVLFLSPLLVGRHVEHVTLQIWAGATLVVGGALVLVLAG